MKQLTNTETALVKQKQMPQLSSEQYVKTMGKLPVVSDGRIPLQSGSSGYGYSHNHIGEFLQGAIPDPQTGKLTRFLISCAVPEFQGAFAEFTLKTGNNAIQTNPSTYTKSAKVARLLLDQVGLINSGGLLTVSSCAPAGKGLGTSTADCVATYRAVHFSIFGHGRTPSPDLIAKIVVAAEGAADSVMYDARYPIVFAHREGRKIMELGGPLPQMKLLAFDTALEERVETDKLKGARYSTAQINSFSCAIALFEKGVRHRSVELLGRVATFSAKTSENAMADPYRKPKFQKIIDLVDSCGSAGLVVSHSGTVAALIFDPEHYDLSARVMAAKLGIRALGFGSSQLFDIT